MLITWATHKAGGLTTTHVTFLVYTLPLCLLLRCAASICSSAHTTTNECLDWSHKRNEEGGAFHFDSGGQSIARQTIYMVENAAMSWFIHQYTQMALQSPIQKKKLRYKIRPYLPV